MPGTAPPADTERETLLIYLRQQRDGLRYAAFGLTEEQLTESATPYVAGIARWEELARGLMTGDEDGMLKLLVSTENRSLLGVHVIGNTRRRDGAIDIARHLIPVRIRGEVAAQVLAVSYPTAACLPPLQRAAEGAGSPIVRAVRILYEQLAEAAEPVLEIAVFVSRLQLRIFGQANRSAGNDLIRDRHECVTADETAAVRPLISLIKLVNDADERV